MSHPPDSADIAPKRMYSPDSDDGVHTSSPMSKPLNAHVIHKSYLHKIVPVNDVLDPDFIFPFATYTSRSATRLSSLPLDEENEVNATSNDKKAVLVLDARGSSDLQILARAWCAEKGYNAITGRADRTCLACCVREARGLGVHVVIRV